MMRLHIDEIDFVFRLQKYGKRLSLGVIVYSVNFRHYFPKSTNIFLSNDHYRRSTLVMYSRGLKIQPQSTVRGQSNGREREGSLVTKSVDSERI